LYLFPRRNPIRKCSIYIMLSRPFEIVITLFILLSSMALAFENPLDNPEGNQAKIFKYFDIISTIVFTLEVLTKIIAKGLIINGKRSYLRDIFQIIDFIIVIVSIIAIFDSSN